MRSPRWTRWAVLSLVVMALLATTACCPAANNPPQITGVTPNPASIGPGGSSTITCVANDPDGDLLTYDWTASDGAITWTAGVATWVAPDAEGTFTISVTVDDGRGGMATGGCYVTVGVATGSINVTSHPVGAKVYLDGEDTGEVTPCNIAGLTQGSYTMMLIYYHYKDKVGTVTVNTGLVTYIDWTLTYADENTRTIQPGPADGNDAYVYEDSPADNYGSEEFLFAGAELMYEHYRSYLQFDLSTIPTTATVVDAQLGLYYDGTSGAVPTIIGVYEVMSSWDEDAVDWAHQPASAATAEDSASVPEEVTKDFMYWDITDLVQGWVDGSVANKGVLLKDTDESTVKAWKRFYSSNHTFYLDRQPKLLITYFDPVL